MNESVRVVPSGDDSGILVQARFKEFLECFKGDIKKNDLGDVDEGLMSQQKILSDYKAQIISMIQNNKSTVYVNFAHIQEMDQELAEAIELEYYRFEPFLRQAVQDIVAMENKDYFFDVDRGQRHFFVSLYNLQRVERIRSMTTSKIGRLVSISGTVTRSSEVRPELLYGIFDCTKCDAVDILVEQQYQYTEPKVCPTSRCDCTNFRLALTKSAFVDWQRLRVQENADEVPPGSMPRCIDVICRNEVCEVAKAGDKVVFTGNIAVVPDTTGLARLGESTVGGRSSGGRGESYADGVKGLKALGVKEMTYKMLFIACSVQHTEQRTGRHAVTLAEISGMGDEREGERDVGIIDLNDAEKEDILTMRNTPHLYNKMADSICPSVFGHAEVKRGVLLMLFGGVHKKTKEGISLRGDLNVCIVGDPSCAKSQFLKYVHGFLPRTIYTSGKSSSAAGLTASVVRDSDTGEFCVEAGALMLADNGICCIDEFDKMDLSDQVAIHEAMEQQTISITKAGIQATLNARTSILAAANPVFGRYDRGKTLKANVAVSAAIMSRFDLFFVILDECNPDIDESIARHIINVHKEGGVDQVCTAATFSREQLQRYISFARSINPTLSPPARKTLVECYRLLRQNDILGKNKTAYRITVRQLESLIRLSEALARLHLDEKVQPVYVREAYRLLQKSIIFVENEDVELDDNEEEMNQLDTQYKKSRDKKRKSGSSEDGSDNEEDERPGHMESDSDRHRNKSEAQVSANDESQLSSSMQIESAAAVSSVSPVAQKKKKVKTQISAKEYEDITHLLCLRLKALEEEFSTVQTSDGAGETYYPGCSWTDLLTWYMKQLGSEIVGEEQFEQKKKLVNQILRRMIKHEGSVIELRTTSDDDAEQDRKLKLHPSFQP